MEPLSVWYIWVVLCNHHLSLQPNLSSVYKVHRLGSSSENLHTNSHGIVHFFSILLKDRKIKTFEDLTPEEQTDRLWSRQGKRGEKQDSEVLMPLLTVKESHWITWNSLLGNKLVLHSPAIYSRNKNYSALCIPLLLHIHLYTGNVYFPKISLEKNRKKRRSSSPLNRETATVLIFCLVGFSFSTLH